MARVGAFLIMGFILYNIKSCLSDWQAKLKTADITSPQDEVVFLCQELLGLNRADLITMTEFSKSQFQKVDKAVKRRMRHVPFGIIVGSSDFMGVKILENRHTLSPRPETALLCEYVLKENHDLKVLDMCSGSGCIGLALRKGGFEDVTLCDVSWRALHMARKNAKNNGLDVKFVKSNMFESVVRTYDIIVSNPPYIRHDDIKTLSKEVKNFDPKLALDGGQDGLDYYKILASNAPMFLSRHGKLFLEIGQGQEDEVVKLLQPHFTNIQVYPDYAGINRIIKAEIKC